MTKNLEEFFYFILNHSQECIVRYDANGCINYCNDRLLELTGRSEHGQRRKAAMAQ